MDFKAEREARTGAAVNCKELTEAIFGLSAGARKQYQEIVAEGPAVPWAKTTTKEEMRGLFQGTEQAGEWRTDDGHVSVAVPVGLSPLPLLAVGEGRR